MLHIAASALYGPLVVSALLAVLAYIITIRVIPAVTDTFIKRGRFGKDLLKDGQPVIAESIGAVVGVVYFIAMFMFIPVPFMEWFMRGTYVAAEHPPFPHDKLAQFLGGLLAIFAMLFLGFADDVLDIRWRVKIWFPLIASMPLLMVYFVTYGKTDVMVPIPLQSLFQTEIVHLGFLYYIYISALAVFSTNAINIMAGANGVEGGQSLVIALSLAINDLIQLQLNPSRAQAHLNSLYFLLPFIGVTFGYLHHNWFPARAFGGDTYAYSAGMVFAVIGVLGNLSKTVLLFMIPQIFNFIYSCPQLFHLVECPRHRMPRRVKASATNLLEASTFSLKTAKPIGRLIVNLFAVFGLVQVKRDQNGHIIESSNLTLMSLILVKLGPLTERDLVLAVLAVQTLCSLLAFFVRYGLVHIFYPGT